MERGKQKPGISRIALDYNLNARLKSLAIKLSKPGERVTIESLVEEAVRKFLGDKK